MNLTAEQYAKLTQAAKKLKFSNDDFDLVMAEFQDRSGKIVISDLVKQMRVMLFTEAKIPLQ